MTRAAEFPVVPLQSKPWFPLLTQAQEMTLLPLYLSAKSGQIVVIVVTEAKQQQL